MNEDLRLRADLEMLRLAVGAYLARLRAVWSHPGPGEGADVDRLLAAVGTGGVVGAREREAMNELAEVADATGGPVGRIVGALGLTRSEELSAAAAWWADADPQFAVVLGCAHDDGSRRYPSAALLRLVLAPFGIEAPPHADDAAPLVRAGVVMPGAGATGAIRLTPTARMLLAGSVPRPYAPPSPLPERLAPLRDALTRHLAGGTRGVVLLRGPAGAGSRALAAEAIAAAGRIPVAGDRDARELRLLGALDLAVPVVPAESAGALGWEPDDPPLVAFGATGEQLPGAYVVDVRAPSTGERVTAWRDGLAGARLDGALARPLAARFQFTEGDIAEVVERAQTGAAWSGTVVTPEDVWEAARRQPEHALERVAALITPAFTLDDLVLTQKAHTQLRELVAHVALQHVVLDDWGFRRRLPRGQGVAALFAGPPGTGKTMAAEAVADALRQDLYRIDLSAVVSKYIGETEKNLAVAFDEAERAGAVLFFDEADSLFGKRTEVRDAHDRYANLEVNYLLQRVESFTGLVILATNRHSAMDEAFLRRLRFSIRFELPSDELRKELWRRSFPSEAPLGDLDWDALADSELSGGSIQSAALAAAYLAASNGGAVTRAHLEQALEREYDKLGRAWTGLREEALA